MTLRLAAVLLVATTAAAPTDKPLPTYTRETVAEFAECVVRKRYAASLEVLQRNVANADILDDYSRLIDSDCLLEAKGGRATRLTLPGDHFRYALAGAIFDRSYAQRPAPTLTGVAPLEHRPFPDKAEHAQELASLKSRWRREELERDFKSATVTAYLSRYGECVVRNDAANARLLLLSTEGAADESLAFSALQPTLAHCLPPNQTLRFSRIQLRGLIALNYVRLALASAAGPA